ncbi:TonB-dependent receptor, partial [bacterium]|nr:TonB-dependent receptor [bacterium]
DHEPLLGTSTDENGNFVLKNVPLGRHDIKFSYLGFETVILRNILVSSGKQTVLNVEMEESVFEGEAIEVVATIQKDKPINDFAKVSVKLFTVEETQRYAGGLDDPGRLVTVFPGVNSTGGVQNNAISIRGNAPKSVQWRLEGIEIPNPNHFAGLSVAGGGGLTLFSAQLLSNSDFFTGAFPSEYGNALSGVFDINFRSGNRNKREHAVQIGINGLEASSGGPIKKNGSATYLFNYRFSTLTLLQPLLPVEGRIQYQDLSFKIDVPTQNSGRFEFWGIGGLDLQTMEAKTDSSKWEYAFSDFTENRIDLGVGAVGVSHSITVNNKGYLKSTLALSGNSTEYSEERFDDNLNLNPYLNIDDNTSRLAFKTFLNQGFGKRITTRTGVELQQLYFNFDLAGKPDNSSPYQSLIRQKDQAQLYQMYHQSEFNVSPRLSILGGLHGQWFSVNDEFVLEPRAAISWQVLPETALNIGYGLHSQIEELDVYFVQPQANFPNKNLKTSKAHHLVASVDQGIGEVYRIKI